MYEIHPKNPKTLMISGQDIKADNLVIDKLDLPKGWFAN
jgi:hypothetical protein